MAGGAEGEPVVGKADGGGVGGASITDEGAEVAAGEGVGGVDMEVAGEAKAGGVGLAVDESALGAAVVAEGDEIGVVGIGWVHSGWLVERGQGQGQRHREDAWPPPPKAKRLRQEAERPIKG